MWYYLRNTTKVGPVSRDRIISLIDSEQISKDTLIWTSGMSDWEKVSKFGSSSQLPESGPEATPPDVPNYVIEAAKLENASPKRRLRTGSSDLLDDIGDGEDYEPEYATVWSRLFASIIDGIILNIVAAIVSMFILNGVSQYDDDFVSRVIIYYSIMLAINVAYYVYFETSFYQGTIGKQAMSIIVTDDEGNRLTVGKSIGRYFAKILSGLILGIGYFMAFGNPQRKALHDSLVGTVVVKKWS